MSLLDTELYLEATGECESLLAFLHEWRPRPGGVPWLRHVQRCECQAERLHELLMILRERAAAAIPRDPRQDP